jgi:hypothetical protein
MSESLQHALKGIVYGSFSPGMDKHADKADGDTFGKIYSYSSRNAMLDVVKTFTAYLKEAGVSIRQPAQLTGDMVSSFLESKRGSCTQKTLDSYRSQLAKLGDCIAARKGLRDFDLHVGRVDAARHKAADRGAGAAISREDYDKILTYCKDHPCGSSYALLLENHLGARVTDVCKRMTVEDDRMRLVCKGGKVMYRPITPGLRDLLSDRRFDGQRSPEGGFNLPASGSVNKYLQRTEAKLGLERHSFHDIRRLLAQEHYDDLRHSGVSRSDALKDVGVWLNHGSDRETLVLTSYIANAW